MQMIAGIAGGEVRFILHVISQQCSLSPLSLDYDNVERDMLSVNTDSYSP